jgi:hypothetical protein
MSSTNFFILVSLSEIILFKVITSVFFLSLDCWADTMFRHFCLCFTSILFSLAVDNFFFKSSIFFSASLKYFYSFSLFRPLLLPLGATLTDDESAIESDKFSFFVTYRRSFLVGVAGLAFIVALAYALVSRFFGVGTTLDGAADVG